MDNSNILPILLSPAGSMNSLYAAINGGCNAVYIGGKNFNARIAADNFTDEELVSAIDYCHLHGVKAYITVNTLYKNKELKQLFNFLQFACEAGADAFIFQDIGAADYALRHFPSIEIHASTQMNTHSLSCARFLKNAGFSRAIFSRELSIGQVQNITKNSGIDTEIFVHGALCVCFSGQCLMSSFSGGRSGNRGCCAQPCRLRYGLYDRQGAQVKEGYLLSPKDIMMLDSLKSIVNSGVSALKIEGRMKSPEYVNIATKTYRKYLDLVHNEFYAVDKSDTEKLLQAFNRGGSFSKGYLTNYSGAGMMSNETPKNTGVFIGTVTNYESKFKRVFIETEKELVPGDGLEIWTKTEPHIGFGVNTHIAAGETAIFTTSGDISEGDAVYRTFDKRLADELKNVCEPNSKEANKIDIFASVTAKAGEHLKIKLYNDNAETEVSGDVVEMAQNAPITAERLYEQINKPDTYPFNLIFSECNTDDNIYLPIKSINEARRSALTQFANELIKSYKRTIDKPAELNINNAKHIENKKISVSVSTKSQFYACLAEGVNRIYVELSRLSPDDINTLAEKAHKNGIEFFISLNRIDVNDDFELAFAELESKNHDGYLIRTYGQLHLLSKSKKTKVLDSGFNVLNPLSAQYLLEFANAITPSQELNLDELSDFDGTGLEVIIHGRQILMTTRQCPIGLYSANKKNGQFCKLQDDAKGYVLKDDKGSELPVFTDCTKCFAFILNSSTLFMLNRINDVKRLNAEVLRLAFTTESAEEAKLITECYIKALNGSENDEATLDVIDLYVSTGIGNAGHFYKGIF